MTKFEFVKNGSSFALLVNGIRTDVGFGIYPDDEPDYAPEFSHTLCNVAYLEPVSDDAEATIKKWCGYENIPYEPTLTHLLLSKAITDALNKC